MTAVEEDREEATLVEWRDQRFREAAATFGHSEAAVPDGDPPMFLV